MAVLSAQRRVALVTGARRDIGAAIAVGLAADGFDVLVHHLDHEEEAHAVVEQCREQGVRAESLRSDLADPGAARESVASAIERFGRIDAVVNNAVRPSNAAWDELSLDEWNQTIAVGLTAPFVISQAAALAMQAQGDGGRIVNISSVTVRLGGPSGAAYVAAKAGLVGLTRSMSRQLGPSGITVNAVSPGAVRTINEVEMYGSTGQAEIDRDMLTKQALQRRLVPDDISASVRFLCSEQAEAITGQVIEVNGGWLHR